MFDITDMLAINVTGEKMLLLNFFCVVISGHMIYKFSITDDTWHRIKLSLDSKCRTAFRRKRKGLPLQKRKAQSEITAINIASNQGSSESFEDLSYLIENAEVCIRLITSVTFEPDLWLGTLSGQIMQCPFWTVLSDL